jgi:hypothetical protein
MEFNRLLLEADLRQWRRAIALLLLLPPPKLISSLKLNRLQWREDVSMKRGYTV